MIKYIGPFLLILAACSQPERPVNSTGISEKEIRESMLRVNNYMVKRNQEQIRIFVKRTGLSLTQESSGLWHNIDPDKAGKKPSENDRLLISFEITLLDGSQIESIPDERPLIYQMGKASRGQGIETALRWMTEGSESLLIVPPHLAEGNFGDRDKIPMGAILMIRLKLKNINP